MIAYHLNGGYSGVVSHTPLPHVTNPLARISAAVGVTPEQITKGVEVGAQLHGMQDSSCKNVPVAVEVQPFASVQVMVYSPVHG